MAACAGRIREGLERSADRFDGFAARPSQSRRVPAAEPALDAPRKSPSTASRVDPAVLRQLGEWRAFRPSFSALPANLAATFQPEGDGLGSADNPLDPHVGDLRIHWRELVLPALDDRLVLRDGRWRLTPAAQADAPKPLADATVPSPLRLPRTGGRGSSAACCWQRWPAGSGGNAGPRRGLRDEVRRGSDQDFFRHALWAALYSAPFLPLFWAEQAAMRCCEVVLAVAGAAADWPLRQALWAAL